MEVVLEMSFEDFHRKTEDTPSPDWHGDILNERAKGLYEEKDKFQDWCEAKKDLRDSTS